MREEWCRKARHRVREEWCRKARHRVREEMSESKA